MIALRTLSSEIGGNGLKGRVTACRKRLRVNRVTQRAQVNKDVGELFAEPIPTVSGLQDEAAEYSITTSVVRADYRSPFAKAQHGELETLVLAGEQEVGIT